MFSFQNRVKAKTGKTEHVGRFEQEATASWAGNHAPVRALVAKPPARIFQTERKADIGYEPSEELQTTLRPIFQHYCGFGERDNYTYMSRAQWLKFARDCGLVCDHLDLIQVDLIFDQVNATSMVLGENTKRLSFHEFLGALGSLALAMYDEVSLDQLGDEGASFNALFAEAEKRLTPETPRERRAETQGGDGGGEVGFGQKPSSPRVTGGPKEGLTIDVSSSSLGGGVSGSIAGPRTPGTGIRMNNLRNTLKINCASPALGGSAPSSPASGRREVLSPTTRGLRRESSVPKMPQLQLPAYYGGGGDSVTPTQGVGSPSTGARKQSHSQAGHKGSLRPAGDTITAETAVNIMVNEWVLPRAVKVPTHGADALAEVISSEEVLASLAAHQSALRDVFNFYSCVEEPVGYGRALRWSDVRKSRAAMSQREWQKFVQDFHLLPDILSKVQIAACFREANFGDRGTSDTTRLSFPEFEDCIARCALRAYGYKLFPDDEVASVFFEQPIVADGAMDSKIRSADRVFTPDSPASSASGSPRYVIRCKTGAFGPKEGSSPKLFRERAYAYKEKHAPGTSPAFTREYPQLYCPLAGLPTVYHSTMVDMVSERERQDEAAERIRKAGLMEAREQRRAVYRNRRMQREKLESRAGARTVRDASAIFKSTKGMAPDGSVKRYEYPAIGVLAAPLAETARKVEPWLRDTTTETLYGSPPGTARGPPSRESSASFDIKSLADFPDIHSSYHAKSRMSNVLTVKRLDGGRFVPVNKAGVKVREGTGTTQFSMGDRTVHV